MALKAGYKGIKKYIADKLNALGDLGELATDQEIAEAANKVRVDIAPVLEEAKAPAGGITAGDQFYLNDILYTASADIAAGADIIVSGDGKNADASSIITAQLAEKTDNSVIAPVEDGATASQGYVVRSCFIRNGAFCIVTTPIARGESLVESNKFISRDVADCLYIKDNNLSSADDLDAIVTEGVYGISTTTPINAPSGVANCPLHVHVTSDGRVVQTIIRVTNTIGDIYVRYKGSTNWYNWFVIHGTEVTP